MTCAQIAPPRYAIGKVNISAVTMAEALQLLDAQVRWKESAYVCVANVETTVLSQKDEEFCCIQNESLMTLPDGMPLVWYARVAGVHGVERITGIDLMEQVLEVSPQKGYTHYFLGDTPQTLSATVRTVRDRYPGTVVIGTCSPPFRDLADDDLIAIAREINREHPDFVWVALGAPKQERFMSHIINKIDRSILVGAGAAFRVMTGYYKRPPEIIRKLGLEGGFWRCQHQPLREVMWYARYIPAFAPLFLRGLMNHARWK